MSTVEGIVQYVGKKPTKFGHVYSFKISDEWYGGMFDEPKATEGDTVRFEIEPRGGFMNVKKGTLEVVAKGPAASGSPGNTRDYVPAEDRQFAIEYQSSRHDAVVALDTLLREGALSLGAKKSGKEEVYISMLDKLTNELYYHLQHRKNNPPVEEDVISVDGGVEDDIDDVA